MQSLSKNYLVLIAVLAFVVFGLTPLMVINDMWVTIFPIFNNTVSDYKIWEWRNISAFTLTHCILILLSIIFTMKKNITGMKILTSLYVINSFFILFVIWLSKLNAQPFEGVNINYSFGWIFCIIGIISHSIIIKGLITIRK
ncbi:MAG: hypothetical protein KKA84_00800 [Bacteroidetes bacterium]|nr:hypothetical protein [Bacteroidota bacterium]